MTPKDIILLIISISLPLLFLLKPVLNYRKAAGPKNLKNFITIYKFELITIAFLIIGFILRLYRVGSLPLGFNQDEASLGYDAFSIMNYGIDRNGVSIPVHLVSWGSGQNVLYAYICMPFIKLFGLNEFAVRLPMALIGCTSLLIMKKLLETIGSLKLTAIGIFLFSIMPWHIMKSRWGLESNIFPDLILWAVMLIILGVQYKKRYLYIGSIVLGLSAYAYGTSYFFLPVFSLLLFAYLLYYKKIKIRNALISLGIIFTVSLPLILFVIINQFNLNSIVTPLFTIPKLNQARQASIINLDGNIFKAIISNLGSGFKLLLIQNDGLPWNSISFYGTHYVISLPFLIIGIFAMFKKKGFKIDFLFFNWLIASLLMLAIMSANINRINIIFIPILYFIILGLHTIVDSIRFSWLPILAVYAVVAAMFIFTYFGSYQETMAHYFFNGLGEAIKYSEELYSETIYVSNGINSPYIFELFYNQTDPSDYIDSVIKQNDGAAFEKIISYDKYKFIKINVYDLDKRSVYIIEKSAVEKAEILYSDANFNYFEDFAVISFD